MMSGLSATIHFSCAVSMRTLMIGLAVATGATGLLGCAGKRVQRVDAAQVVDLSGKWNDTDARQTSRAMVGDLVNGRWLLRFSSKHSRQPSVRVRGIVNKTDEHIDAQVFIKNLEKAMVNSGKISVLAQDGGERASIRAEQADAASGVQSDDSPVSSGNEQGADFALTIYIASIVDKLDGISSKFYKISAQLIDTTRGQKVWIGDHEIKKVIDQDKYTF